MTTLTTTAPHLTPLADQFAAGVELVKDGLEMLEGVLSEPALAEIARQAQPWRRRFDLALGCERTTTAEDTLRQIRMLAEPAGAVAVGCEGGPDRG